MLAMLERVVECVADEGYEAELVDFIPGIRWHLRTTGETTDQADRADAALEGCQDTHAEAVMDAYWAQRALTAEEQAQFDTSVQKCLEDAGVTASDGRSSAAAIEPVFGAQFTMCQTEAMSAVR